MFNLLGAIFSGLFVGLLARWFYPGVVDIGLVLTVLLGIGGSIVASFIASVVSGRPYRDGFNRSGCFAAVLGAMLLIFVARHF
jgi:uncharacterized membrane protein YeaQ/YmgE (transglycosylase-associated protein family)